MNLGRVAVVLLGLTSPAQAQQADVALLEMGMRLFKDALTPADGGAGCELCHNWNGVGRQHNLLFADLVPAGGTDLTKSTMTREQMIEMVACGTFDGGRIMPRFYGDAWTNAYKCYGKTAAEDALAASAAGPPKRPPQPGMRQLAPREIEAVVAYVQAVYQGKSMSLDWCLKWYGTSSKGCDNWRPVVQ